MKRLSLSTFYFLAAVLVAYIAMSPLGLSPDSFGYLSAADSVVTGEGFYNGYRGRIMVDWPPLYPALLAALQLLTGAQLVSLATAVNLFAGLSLLALLWKARGGVAAALGLLSPVVLIFGMAWTEPLFLLFVALFLYQAAAYWTAPGRRSLSYMIGAAALASLTRYTGVVAIASGALLILGRRRYRDLALFCGLSGIPLALWLLRNHLLTGTLTGNRLPSSYTLGDNLMFTTVGLVTMLGPVVVLIFLAWHRIRRAPWPSGLTPALLFLALYLVFLNASSTAFHYDPINLRLLSPVQPSVALIGGALVQSIIEGQGMSRTNRAEQS